MIKPDEMLANVKQIMSKGFVYTLIFLVCLSCPVKRELKRILNIPISSVEQPNKPAKTQFCAFAANQSAKEIRNQIIAKKIQLPDPYPLCPVTTITSKQPSAIETCDYRTVPIYIQNEQFLI